MKLGPQSDPNAPKSKGKYIYVIPFYPPDETQLSKESKVDDRKVTTHTCLYDRTKPDGPTFKCVLVTFDNCTAEGAPEEWINLQTHVKEVANSNGMTDTIDVYHLWLGCLGGKPRKILESEWEKAATHDSDALHDALRKISLQVFPK